MYIGIYFGGGDVNGSYCIYLDVCMRTYSLTGVSYSISCDLQMIHGCCIGGSGEGQVIQPNKLGCYALYIAHG